MKLVVTGLFLAIVSTASALAIPAAARYRTRASPVCFRSAVHLTKASESLSKLDADTQECIVDAENAAEIAACLGEDAPAPPVRQPSDVDECIVDAENAAEIAACNDVSLGDSYEDCIVNAESAAEAAECGTTSVEEYDVVVVDEECIVNAENAAEIAACADTTIGLTYEECITDAENAAEIEDCGVAPTSIAAEPAMAAVDEECIVNAENAAEQAECQN